MRPTPAATAASAAVDPKAAGPKAAGPKAAGPKAGGPKAATLKSPTLKAATLKAATLKAATLKAATLKAETLKAETLKSPTLKSADSKAADLKGAGPNATGPKTVRSKTVRSKAPGPTKARIITARAHVAPAEVPPEAAPPAVIMADAPGPRGPAASSVEAQIGWVIANQVRARRQEVGLTIAQVADRAGISKALLSKIENAQASPSVTRLARLATALEIPVTSLFQGLAEEREAVFVKAGHGAEIVRPGTRAGLRYQLLGTLRHPYKVMEPLLVTLTEPSEPLRLFQHPGVEMLYMLQGVMEYGCGASRYRMERGDVLQFEGDIAHGPTRLVKLPISFLSVTAAAGG